MEKYFKGFLFGCFVAGIFWLSYGRTNIKRIDQSFTEVDRNFKEVQRALNTVTNNTDGFARDISEVSKTSKRIENRSGTIRDRLTEVDGGIRFVAGEVDKLEGWNRQIVIIGRDLGDVSADFRKFNR